MQDPKRVWFTFAVMALVSVTALSANSMGEGTLGPRMADLVFQLGVLVLGAFFTGRWFERLHLPKVLGELFAGILLGPHVLGGLALPWFPQGLFASTGTTVPVLPELYGLATLASVILLFNAGLETDLGLFKRFALKGSFIGLLEVGLDFILGVGITSLVTGAPPSSPQALVMGVILTATSVGISARNLMENRRMDSPEGTTIMSTAVFDDVLGIIVLAIVTGVLAGPTGGAAVDAGYIAMVALKAVGIWAGFTLAGLLLAPFLGRAIKSLRTRGSYTLVSLGAAFLLAGFFEKAGLAMIIGAYVMGLTLAATDLGLVVQENTRRLRELLVPLFFATMGMMVDPMVFADPLVIVFGLAYSAMAVLGKVIGSGGPSLLMGFNWKGALRIGFGMVPRGEVALTIAGIGISQGFLDQKLLGVVIMMSLVSILVSTLGSRFAFGLPGRGTRAPEATPDLQELDFMAGPELKRALLDSVLREFEAEGFFAHRMDALEVNYMFRKDAQSILLQLRKDRLVFSCPKDDQALVRTVVYESLLHIHDLTQDLRNAVKPEALASQLGSHGGRTALDHDLDLDPRQVSMELKGRNKDEVLDEMIALLGANSRVHDPLALRQAVRLREQSMSTGMQHGMALPHGRCSGLDGVVIAVGIHREGVDFQSLDGKPCQLFIAIASPDKDHSPHLQIMAVLASVFRDPAAVDRLIAAQDPEALVAAMEGLLQPKGRNLPIFR